MRHQSPWRLLLPVLIVMGTTSCIGMKPATLENRIYIKDAKELQGSYSNISSGNPQHAYEQLKDRIDHTGRIKNTDSITSVTVSVTDDRKLAFTFLDRNQKRYQYAVKYKLKDGNVFLRNKNFILQGIPFLLGGYKLNRSELSLTSTGDLLLRSAEREDGAILLIFPASLPPSHFENVYRRVTQ